jgi:hypothetical protein
VEKLEHYRALIKQVMMAEHAGNKPSHGEIEPVVVGDDDHDRHLLLDIGWDGPRRVHGVIMHLALIGGKIWVEHDGTPPPCAAIALIEDGVPCEDIVPTCQPPRLRAVTGCATGLATGVVTHGPGHCVQRG